MNAQEYPQVTEFMNAYWDGAFPVAITEMAHELILPLPCGETVKVRVSSGENEGHSLIMGYTPSEDGSEGSLTLSVNHKESEQRQRYAVAYGIVRALLAEHPEKDLDRAFWDFNPSMADSNSWVANRMATDLLVPKKYLKNRARKNTDIGELARGFGVAPITVRTQLERAGVLPVRKTSARRVA